MQVSPALALNISGVELGSLEMQSDADETASTLWTVRVVRWTGMWRYLCPSGVVFGKIERNGCVQFGAVFAVRTQI